MLQKEEWGPESTLAFKGGSKRTGGETEEGTCQGRTSTLQQQGSEPSTVDLEQMGNTGWGCRQRDNLPQSRHVAMRFEIVGQNEPVNFVAAYPLTEVSKVEIKQVFWPNINQLVECIPTKECVCVR